MTQPEKSSTIFIVSPDAFASHFSSAFDNAVKRAKTFGAAHQAQLDQLEKLLAALSKGGVFTAKTDNFIGASTKPMLNITHVSSGEKISYAIGFSEHPVDAACTMTFSKLKGTPVGRKTGYDLLDPGDASALAVALAEDMAVTFNHYKLGEKTTAHFKQQKK